MIECCATGLVYRNPKPHLRSVHAWRPSVVLLGAEELLVSFDLGALKFGYPSLVQLADGDVFVVFWCCEDCVYNIRWFRIHLS